jgi:fatty acyl-CoA reductase
MLDLAETFDNLKSFVYVSTAFSNTHRKIIEEKVYDPPIQYEKVFEVFDRNDPYEMQQLEKMALKIFPNTYVFTKNLAEKLVSERNLPSGIVRPSIVACAAREPMPGWLEFKRAGVIGTTFIAGLGIHRTLYADGDIFIETIPVDFCANTIIAVCSDIAQRPRQKSPKVFNLISSSQSNFTVRDSWRVATEAGISYPSKNMAWYPGMKLTKYYPIFLLRFVLLQLIPAMLIDFFLMLSGQKAQLVKVQKEIYDGTMGFSYFILNRWIWCNDNLINLFDSLSPTDKYVTNSFFYIFFCM